MELTYEDYIDGILSNRGRFNCMGYYETHHIIPKCLGGTNDKDNLINLYAQEHYIAHKLLAQENQDNNDLQLAWYLMCTTSDSKGRKYNVSDEDFARAKQNNSDVRKKIMQEYYSDEKNRKAQSRRMIEFWDNEELRKRRSESQFNLWNNEEYLKNMQEKHSRRWEDDEYRASHSGENSGMFGKPSPNRKSVYCIELDMTFSSTKEAAEYVGIKCKHSISQSCSNPQLGCGRHPETGERLHWRFI